MLGATWRQCFGLPIHYSAFEHLDEVSFVVFGYSALPKLDGQLIVWDQYKIGLRWARVVQKPYRRVFAISFHWWTEPFLSPSPLQHPCGNLFAQAFVSQGISIVAQSRCKHVICLAKARGALGFFEPLGVDSQQSRVNGLHEMMWQFRREFTHRASCMWNGGGLTMRVSNVRIEKPRPPCRAFRFRTPILASCDV